MNEIIADAIDKKADTLIIAGHFQSNAARSLVGVAYQLGIKSIVVYKAMIYIARIDFIQEKYRK